MSLSYKGFFEDWEVALVRKLINEFRSKAKCLRKENVEDLQQDCLIHWIEVQDAYDPTREASKQTFMARVIRNKLNNIIEKILRDKRKTLYECLSLNELVGEDENSSSFTDQITDADQPPFTLKADLKTDLDKTIKKLTPQQQKLCRLLQEGKSINEISSCLGKHRTSVFRETIRIRELFEKEGLKDYLR